VIHTVGPVWRDGAHGEDDLLASCYRSCFQLVEQHRLKTVAFPAISTGAYGFPLDRAARIAVREAKDFLERDSSVERVVFVCFGQPATAVYSRALQEVAE
jgi:O-acetyl-ADP-ribose deacetylase